VTGNDRSDRGDGVIGVAGAGQTLGGEKEMKREKKCEDRQRMNKER